MSSNSINVADITVDSSVIYVFVVSVGCALTAVFYYFKMATSKRHRSTSSDTDRKSRPPGPRRYPVVGNLLQLSGDDMFYVKLNEMRETHGDVLYLELGAVKMLVVFGHDQVSRVLEDQHDRFKFRPIWLVEVKSLHLTNGIVWSNGLQNERLRRFAVPVVHPGVGQTTLEQRIQTEATMLVKEMLKEKGDSSVLKRLFYQTVSNINCGILFGSRYDYCDDEFQQFIDLMDQLLQRGGIKNPLNFFPILQHLPEGKKIKCTKAVMSKVTEFIHNKIESARDTFDKDNIRSLLDLYLAQESNTDSDDHISEENVVHIVRDFFVAGTENVAIGLLWLVGYMVEHKDVQQKCRACVTEVLQRCDSKESPGVEDIPNMPYLEATVQEVLRLANIAPLSVPHAVVEDVEFEDYMVPKDTMVLTHLQSVHMDPNYWDKPEEFNPDRFIENNNVMKKSAFYPFSMGTRYCLAAKLAQMELNIMFAVLLRSFNFSVDENTTNPPLKQTQPGAFVEPADFQVNWVPV